MVREGLQNPGKQGGWPRATNQRHNMKRGAKKGWRVRKSVQKEDQKTHTPGGRTEKNPGSKNLWGGGAVNQETVLQTAGGVQRKSTRVHKGSENLYKRVASSKPLWGTRPLGETQREFSKEVRTMRGHTQGNRLAISERGPIRKTQRGNGKRTEQDGQTRGGQIHQKQKGSGRRFYNNGRTGRKKVWKNSSPKAHEFKRRVTTHCSRVHF